jgi:ribosomal protein S4
VWPIVVRKTIIIGSTEGDVARPDREEKMGLNVHRKKRGLQKWRLSPSLIATERDPLHLLKQAILEHQLLERLERRLDLIVARIDLQRSNSLEDVSAVGRAEASQA